MAEQVFSIFIIPENLYLKEGIWYSDNYNQVSYPAEGNDDCFKVEDTSYWFKHRNQLLHGIIKKYSYGRLLFDIGGGNGAVTNFLCRKGFEVFLVEPGISGCYNARERGIKNIINSTFENAGFKLGSLNNIGLFDVVEHIEDDQKFMKELFKITSPGGRIFITVPAYNFLWSEADIHAGHYRRYSLKSVSKLLENGGYKTIYSTFFFSFLVPLIYLFRVIPNKIFRNTGNRKIESDHSAESKFVLKVIDSLCRKEHNLISKGKKIWFGSSILIVGEKL